METTELVTREQLGQLVPVVVQQVNAITVASKEDDERASEFVKEVMEKKKQVEEFFRPLVNRAREAYDGLVQEREKFLGPLETARKMLKLKIGTYRDEQDRIKRVEEARRAAEEKRRLEQEALERAAALEKAGQGKLAEKVVQQAIKAPPPKVFVESKVAKHTGVAVRKVWKFRILDERQIPREWLMVDTVKIGKAVRDSEGQAQIPGVETYYEMA